MATFEDITGWKDELKALEGSDVSRSIYGTKGWYEAKKIPLAALNGFAKLILMHEETRCAARDMYNFLELPDRYGETDPRYPHQSHQTLIDFGVWYTLKTGHGPNDKVYIMLGQWLAGAVATGEFDSVESESAQAALRDKLWFDTNVQI